MLFQIINPGLQTLLCRNYVVLKTMNFVAYTYLSKVKQIRIINNVPSTQVNRW